jgi:hypothetical protein
VLTANAGIFRDKSFTAMSDKEWDQVTAVHLRYVSHNPVRLFAEARVGAHLRLLFNSPTIAEILIPRAVCQGRVAHLPQTEIWPYFGHCVPVLEFVRFPSLVQVHFLSSTLDRNFGQGNYSTATGKAAIVVGFTRASHCHRRKEVQHF